MGFFKELPAACLAIMLIAPVAHSQSASAMGAGANQQMYSSLSRQMSTLRGIVESGFSSVREDIKTVNTRLHDVEARLGDVEGRLDDVEERLGQMDGQLSDIKNDIRAIAACGGKKRVWNGSGCVTVSSSTPPTEPANCGAVQHGGRRNQSCPSGQTGVVRQVCNNGIWVTQSSTCQSSMAKCGNKKHGATRTKACPGGRAGKIKQVCNNGTWVEKSNTCAGAGGGGNGCQPGYILCDGVCRTSCAGDK